MSQPPNHQTLSVRITKWLDSIFQSKELRRRLILCSASVVFCFITYVIMSTVFDSVVLQGFEIGKVAESTVVAENDIIFVDKKATEIRADAERRLVSAIFIMDDGITENILKKVDAFKKDFQELVTESNSSSELILLLHKRFPDMAEFDYLDKLAESPFAQNIIEYSKLILEQMLGEGIFSIPDSGIEKYNPDSIEVRHQVDGQLSYKRVASSTVVTEFTITKKAEMISDVMNISGDMKALAIEITNYFAAPNVFFDASRSATRMEDAISNVEPVTKTIPKGQSIVRKGFIVTAEDMENLAAVRGVFSKTDAFTTVMAAVFCVFLAVCSVFVLDKQNTGVYLDWPQFVFIIIIINAYFVVSLLLNSFLPIGKELYMELFMPTALVSMLVSILIGEKFALLFTPFLASCLILTGGFSVFYPAQAFFSGIVGIVLVRRAGKRIDLVRAGFQLALVRFISGLVFSALASLSFADAFQISFGSAINGFFCAVLALAFLPILEQTLNVATVFRLQELSDLNSPALKQLLAVAPGTYSHSITVAHLAETACSEIGANPLLARVGAYYHDIGKIDKPEYFIENQSGYNKHDEINPRLSATVLRGHVSFGLERAEMLHLPLVIKSIIAEHHGTSVMSFFYNIAKKNSDDVRIEDYRYPGPLPRSKEAAVIMLADCSEAASRAMKQPTYAKIEELVNEIVMSRYNEGQLSDSPLTFRDFEIIRRVFVKVLSGHFHSRIEYPKNVD